MTISFQTITVGAVVTVAHLAAIIAIKPATLEASRYFQALEMDSFVEEVLVKHVADAATEPMEAIPEVLAEAEVEVESEPEPVEAPEKSEPVVVPESTVEFAESFIDLEKEMDSMKAVTDVRVFSGRIEKPVVHREGTDSVAADPETRPDAPAAPVTEEPAAKKPVKTGPFELREIRPVSRP